jgi:cellulose biosynthesis protein BcsQ
MGIRMALFNHKGGVSKTTTTFHLGWTLASKGHRVILVDADPQCNLSGLVLGLKGEQEFEEFYQDEADRNIRAGLAPAFESQPRPIQPVACLEVPGCEGLFLLPGHIQLSEYEVTLGIAQELSGSIQTLQNLPGALAYLMDVTAERHKADFVIVDMNPSVSSINQNLLMTSDYFLIPASPDYFSVMAIESLSNVIPRWQSWSTRAKTNPVLKGATYPYPSKDPKFLGTVVQKFRPRKGAPTIGFQKWIDTLNKRVSELLVPSLEPLGMMLPRERYEQVEGLLPNMCLALVADFNTLIAKSQEYNVPVFELSEEQLGHVGAVLEADQDKMTEFKEIFSYLADTVTLLTANETSA